MQPQYPLVRRSLGVSFLVAVVGGVTGIEVSNAIAQPTASPPLPQSPFVADGQVRTITPWTTRGMMRNPVSICLDWQGTMYVAESDRAGNAVSDTRGLGRLNAVEEDLQFKAVEDRREQIHRWLAKGAFPSDFFTKTEDRVRVLRDTDGDGKADWSGVFAGGFNDELDGIGAGVLWSNNTLYYTCIPNLWALTPGKDPYVASERKSLSYGYGVRWCFYGHDLHGLVLGPDGRLYFSMGDRGFNVKTMESESLVGVDRGGVFRCWPDGTGLELFYQGLRNPQDLAFNELGELFTGDNNCDSGDRARLVHVVEGGDSGWRQDVQSLPSRGPWNREAMWKTLAEVSGAARPAWALPPVEYMGDGPSGILLYPGTGESHAYDGCLFMVDFYGSGAKVHSFRCVPNGAGFRLADHQNYYTGATITDIAWGYDGRLYMSDWGGGWEPNPNGKIFVARNETVHRDASEGAAIAQVQELFKAGYAQRSDDELVGLLGHRDQRARLAAQYELAGRGTRAVAALTSTARSDKSGLLQRVHALWALGQIARKEPVAGGSLRGLLDDPDSEIRAQAMRTLGDVGGRESAAATAKYTAMLSDPAPRVKLYAAIALGKLGDPSSIKPLLAMLDSNNNGDLVLRHAGSFALSSIRHADQLLRELSGLNAAARLGAVVALRRMRDENVARFINDADSGVAIEAARAVYDLRSAGGLPMLAALLDRPIAADRAIEPLMRRAIEANVLVGSDECVKRLLAFAGRSEIASEWRLLALERVSGWDKPLKREGVWGNWADLPARNTPVVESAVRSQAAGVIAANIESPDVALRAKQLEARYALGSAEVESRLRDGANDREYRLVLLEELARRTPARLGAACENLLASGADGPLKARAEEFFAKSEPAAAVEYLSKAAGDGDVRDRQRAVRLLGSISLPQAGEAITRLSDKLRAGLVGGSIALDLYEAAMTLPVGSATRQVVSELGVAPTRPRGYTTPLLVSGGNPSAGKELFLHHGSAECVRCHIVGDTGGNAGPNLSMVGSRLTGERLVESLVEPNAVIAAGYGTASAMPAMAQFLSPLEVRDVVAYLKTLSTLKPDQAREHAVATNAAQHKAGPAEGGTTLRWFGVLPIGVVMLMTWSAVTRRRSVSPDVR